ncbi:hypothetical protein FIV00_03270 [Labrenzia sp. THAF82]|uniref:hypothetical protein n=1 Tax=Labrenzia sp. THAF82 TaxID=2587861 RepID=UPI0012683743|nr:hypothetical protein [Labrenzia sp. THAF82]QFT29492.1 hypothetical protein FIV00_03270 [Labrenzia sp. THAF82]
MSQAIMAWAAFKNMARAAGRDPEWAIVAIVLAPIRAAQSARSLERRGTPAQNLRFAIFRVSFCYRLLSTVIVC